MCNQLIYDASGDLAIVCIVLDCHSLLMVYQ